MGGGGEEGEGCRNRIILLSLVSESQYEAGSPSQVSSSATPRKKTSTEKRAGHFQRRWLDTCDEIGQSWGGPTFVRCTNFQSNQSKVIVPSFFLSTQENLYIFWLFFACCKSFRIINKSAKMSKVSGGACPRTPPPPYRREGFAFAMIALRSQTIGNFHTVGQCKKAAFACLATDFK